MKKLLIPSFLFLSTLCACNNKTNDNKEEKEREHYVTAFSAINDSLENKVSIELNYFGAQTYFDEYKIPFDSNHLEEETDFNNVYATQTFIYFLKLLYSNENYPINNNTNFVECTYLGENNDMYVNDMYIVSSMEEENNVISTKVYGLGYIDDGETITYQNMCLDLYIHYDFENKELLAFDLYSACIENLGDQNSKNDDEIIINTQWFQRYEDDILYNAIDDIYSTETLNNHYKYFWYGFRSTLDDAQNVGDFSEEYKTATNEVYNKYTK
jgi:hypothetical protein